MLHFIKYYFLTKIFLLLLSQTTSLSPSWGKIKNEHGFAANLFVGVATNKMRWQLMKLTCVLSHVHVT